MSSISSLTINSTISLSRSSDTANNVLNFTSVAIFLIIYAITLSRDRIPNVNI